MWKDWLAFTRKEQYGILVLTILIFILLIVRLSVGIWDEPPQRVEKAEINDLIEFEEVKEPAKSQQDTRQYHFSGNFNPNKVNVTALDEMGFSSYAVVNWIKYLEAGGHFSSLSDVGKVYGIDSIALVQMAPFVHFSISREEPASKSSPSHSRNFRYNQAKQDISHADKPGTDVNHEVVKVEINSATPEDFRQIRGIGEVYSSRIVAYRNLLGGFYSVNQIREVYGISEELFDDLCENFEIEGEPFRKIKINEASLRVLKAHPYISFYQARDIIEYRNNNGAFEEPETLEQLASFDGNELKRILPYFSF
ncbi:helix-hairpin-helix domain-containing protein [Marinilabilia rubra]|uniref:DNA-binding protein n=1 Tax=Marinilabilia rubra TaxID=2162893 RepID=A0A2U2B5P4_9BACT|nr:helix-hairpin-helix domain-containing protein [Marinilabilia rubra]PWD98376.1 DNA-binding protein [Marinilabilia rubra]